uniref:Protein FAM102A n=1 Tax=Cacopsylla melanoneura TaxID=428564 RepID=A0A8D8ZBZ5_9HEMI
MLKMFEKKYKFQCKIKVMNLTHTPYLCGGLYCKLKLLDGNLVGVTRLQMILNHQVEWNEEFDFIFQTALNKTSHMLKPCILRISVRMESSTENKIGYLDLNLSEFSGFGVHHLRFHLKSYNSSATSDNSILEISLDTKILQGNVIFKPSIEATENRISEILMGMEYDEEKPCIKSVQVSSPIPIPSRNMYSPWIKANRHLNDEILNINVRESSKITSTRMDNDQITDAVLNSTFLCLQPADTSRLTLLMTDDGQPVLGQALIIPSPVISKHDLPRTKDIISKYAEKENNQG